MKINTLLLIILLSFVTPFFLSCASTQCIPNTEHKVGYFRSQYLLAQYVPPYFMDVNKQTIDSLANNVTQAILKCAKKNKYDFVLDSVDNQLVYIKSSIYNGKYTKKKLKRISLKYGLCDYTMYEDISDTLLRILNESDAGKLSNRGRKRGGSIKTYQHPTLGGLNLDDLGWFADEVVVPYCKEPVAVRLSEGDKDGPSKASLSGYNWIEDNWSEVLKLIQDQAWFFYEPYFDAVPGIPEFKTAEEIWGTETELFLDITSKDEFTVTMRFTWQEEEDPHSITFYIENGECETHSVDG